MPSEALVTPAVHCKTDADWLEQAIAHLDEVGFVAVEGVLDPAFIERVRPAMYRSEEKILGDIGRERVERAGDGGVVRLMMDSDPVFFEFLEIPEVLPSSTERLRPARFSASRTASSSGRPARHASTSSARASTRISRSYSTATGCRSTSCSPSTTTGPTTERRR